MTEQLIVDLREDGDRQNQDHDNRRPFLTPADVAYILDITSEELDDLLDCGYGPEAIEIAPGLLRFCQCCFDDWLADLPRFGGGGADHHRQPAAVEPAS
jgi:hypothetical protein